MDAHVADLPEAVLRFQEGGSAQDWDLMASAISDDFVRIGLRDDEADTCRGKEAFLRFVDEVVDKFEHWCLKVQSGSVSTDGRQAAWEAIETIQPPGEPPLVMRLLMVAELNYDGLICKLDIFCKTPPRTPPSWIAVESVLAGPPE
jgi:hypothetical protein